MRVGVECAKVIAETMSSLLTQWWDRIVYWRYETFDKKMTALSKTTSFASTIHELIQQGAITEEVGENLKIRVFREVEALTGIGAIIPVSKAATIDHQQLLTEVRNTKLLRDGSPTDGSPTKVAEEPQAAPPDEKRES